MKNEVIPVLRPTYDDQTIAELVAVLKSGWVGNASKTQEFEKVFADYVGAKFCIATNSGTTALDLCLKVYGITGGELITTPMTFVADAIVGEWNNMDVTFSDIDPKTLCLDPEALHVTEETKAIIAVDSHGRLADIESIREKSKVDVLGLGYTYPLIIEDAAHAMYTPGAGKKADITIWSFQAVKTLPIFDGGAITTNDEKIYKKLRNMIWLGVEKSTFERSLSKRYTWNYDIVQTGVKGYMNDVQAVIGLGQLRRLEETNAKRRTIQATYNYAFAGMPQIEIPEHSHTVQYYTMKCDHRDELSEFLAERGIITSVHFKPLSEMTYWKKAVKRDLPVTNEVWKKLLSLPVHNAMTFEQIEYVIASVKAFYK